MSARKFSRFGGLLGCILSVILSGCNGLSVGSVPFETTGAAPSPSPSPVSAPAALTYSLNPASYKVASLITPNSPMTTGGAPTSYSITPTLPAGLAFSTATGVITGTPTAVSAAASYTVTATNSSGSAQTSLSITVLTNIVAPSNLTYSNPAPIFIKGVTTSGFAPILKAGLRPPIRLSRLCLPAS